MRDAEAKLTTIAAMIAGEKLVLPLEDTKEEARNRQALAQRLNGLLTPADVFLELTYYSSSREQIEANVGTNRLQDDDNYWARGMAQQSTYNNPRNSAVPKGAFVPGLNEIPPLSNGDPMVPVNRAGATWISRRIEWSDNVPFVVVSVPVRFGEILIGLLVGSVNLAPVRSMLSSLASGKASLILTDEAGSRVVSDGPDGGGQALERSLPADARGWSLSIRQPSTEALATLTRARRQSWMFFGAALFLALAVSALFTARIVAPVRALSRTAERMGAGDLAARSHIRRADELGQLARAFDAMAESLQKLDQLKSDFVSHVSHELRTPLTSIKLSVANLQDGVVGELDARQLEVLGRVRGDLDRLIRMVNELLDEARLAAGKVELVRDPCDLADIASTAAETVRPLAARKGVSLAVEAKAAPLTGDRGKLHEVVMNLVDNAVKFTPAGGSVRVTTSATDAAVECAVEDTGPGIPEEIRPRIFDRFAAIPASGAPKPAGAGLGLSIARKLVELHRGSIRAENGARQGARFVVTIPRT
jgi:signal transduction histidine kinase